MSSSRNKISLANNALEVTPKAASLSSARSAEATPSSQLLRPRSPGYLVNLANADNPPRNRGSPGNGGGSNGPGGDNFPEEGSSGLGYLALMVLLGGVIVQIGNIIISFGVRILNTNSENLLKALEKLLGQKQIEKTPPKPQKVIISKNGLRARRRGRGSARSAELTQGRPSGVGVCWSYELCRWSYPGGTNSPHRGELELRT